MHKAVVRNMPETRIAVVGAGKIGAAVARMLAATGRFRVSLLDMDQSAIYRARRGHRGKCISPVAIDFREPGAFGRYLENHPHEAVVSCLPFFRNAEIARVAIDLGTAYFDPCEDRDCAREIGHLAAVARRPVVPRCGFAPGYISSLAADLINKFDSVYSVKLRAGILPAQPDNALKFSLNWAVDGLINEYVNSCQELEDGRLVERAALDAYEIVDLYDGQYEAFNCAGGLGSLAESYQGRARIMNFKCLRYAGHLEKVRFLIRDLMLGEDKSTLKRILERAIPRNKQDVALAKVSVMGIRNGILFEKCSQRRLYPRVLDHKEWSAVQIATAANVCAMIDLTMTERNGHKGLIKQEEIPLERIEKNAFGKLLRMEESETERKPGPADEARPGIWN